jgi:TPR repeat protein
MNNDFSEILKSAERGDASAQNKLGECYYYGNGVNGNLSEAAKWFGKSAEKGNADAMYHLSECYHLGDGVGKDDDKAAQWLCKAAEQGSAQALSELDNSHRSGEGVMQYKVKAAESYRKAASEARANAGADTRIQPPAAETAASSQRQASQDPMLGKYYCKRYKDTIVIDSPTHAYNVYDFYGPEIIREFFVTINGSHITLNETSNNYGSLSNAQWNSSYIPLPLANLFKGSFNGKKTVLKGYWHHQSGHTSSHFVYDKVN